jgi:hypothetical protein
MAIWLSVRKYRNICYVIPGVATPGPEIVKEKYE